MKKILQYFCPHSFKLFSRTYNRHSGVHPYELVEATDKCKWCEKTINVKPILPLLYDAQFIGNKRTNNLIARKKYHYYA